MVARFKPKAGRRGGVRAGAGRTVGRRSEKDRVASARAKLSGLMPRELLLDWARTGKMDGVQLMPQQRLYAANAAARYYDPPMQPRPADGVQPPVHKIVLSAEILEGSDVGELQILRRILVAMQKGAGLDPAMFNTEEGESADPARYEALLTADSATKGSA